MARLQLVPAEAVDRDRVAALVQANMREAYARHDRHWDPAAFAADWVAGDNYLLRYGRDVVGYARLFHAEGRSYLQDLQIEAGRQGRGLGTLALDAIMAIARWRGSSVLRLKVFADSPAIRLYRRHGFIELRREPPLIGMECRLHGRPVWSGVTHEAP